MTVRRLASKDNPLLKTVRLVSSGARRAPEELAVAEGVRVLEEAEKSGCEIDAIVLSEHFGSSAREARLLDRWQSRNLPIHRVSENLFKSISSVLSPQGAVALVRIHPRVLNEIPPQQNPLILYACGIQDPGNLGTLIRSAAAAGCSLVCTMKGTVSAHNPKVIRASAGTFFRIPVVEQTELSAFQRYCEVHSIKLYRTDVRNGLIYTKVDLKSPSAILLGNEAGGLDEKLFAQFPGIRIPMADEVESLNVAVAGALILFEASRQRLEDRI